MDQLDALRKRQKELPTTDPDCTEPMAGATLSLHQGVGSDLDALDLPAHIAAWCDCLSAAAGLEPPGTRALRQPGYG